MKIEQENMPYNVLADAPANERIVTINDVYGQVMADLAEEEKVILYDVMQAITTAHDLYVSDNKDAAKVSEKMTQEDGFAEENVFAYWFYTMLFSVLAWRVGFDQATRIGYASLFGSLNQALNGEEANWADFALGLSRTREMAESITDFLFGFKGAADGSTKTN